MLIPVVYPRTTLRQHRRRPLTKHREAARATSPVALPRPRAVAVRLPGGRGGGGHVLPGERAAAQEALLALDAHWGQPLSLFLAFGLWLLLAWYTCRLLLDRRFKPTPLANACTSALPNSCAAGCHAR